MSLKGKKYWDILNIKLGHRKDDRDTFGTSPRAKSKKSSGTQFWEENSALGHHGTVPAALALALKLISH